MERLLRFLEDDDEEIELFYRRRRVINIRPDYFHLYDDFDFVKRFRLSKETVMLLLQDVEMWISPPSHRNNAVPALHRLLLTLRFYATGCMLRTVADFSGISTTSACDFVHLVTMSLCRLRPLYITMPEHDRVREVKKEFFEIARMPDVIGAIDCTHIRLQSPGGNLAEVFRNRKGFMSLNVQTISDAKLRIQSIVARWPGSVHDQLIFNNSLIKQRFENREFGNSLLIGDSGYANSNFLVTPLLQVNNVHENLYNESIIRTRNTVERQYGVWKRRFPVLHVGIRLGLERAQAVVVACAVLHNIAIEANEPAAPEDPQVPRLEHETLGDELQPLGEGNDAVRRRLIHGYFRRL